MKTIGSFVGLVLAAMLFAGCSYLLASTIEVSNMRVGTSINLSSYELSGEATSFTNVSSLVVRGAYAISGTYFDIVDYRGHVFINDVYYDSYSLGSGMYDSNRCLHLTITPTRENYLPAGSYYVKINSSTYSSFAVAGGELTFTVLQD